MYELGNLPFRTANPYFSIVHFIHCQCYKIRQKLYIYTILKNYLYFYPISQKFHSMLLKYLIRRLFVAHTLPYY